MVARRTRPVFCAPPPQKTGVKPLLRPFTLWYMFYYRQLQFLVRLRPPHKPTLATPRPPLSPLPLKAKKVLSEEDAQKALDSSYERFGNAGVDLWAAISRVDKMLACIDVSMLSLLGFVACPCVMY